MPRKIEVNDTQKKIQVDFHRVDWLEVYPSGTELGITGRIVWWSKSENHAKITR